MGRETKIGLAVVGVLLVVFGALLFRRLTIIESAALSSDEPVASAAAAADDADKPHVVSQDQGSGLGSERSQEPAWTRATRDGDGQRGDAPRQVYMPDDAAPVADADDRYANHASRQQVGDTSAVDAPSSNPFQRRAAATSSLETPAGGQRNRASSRVGRNAPQTLGPASP